MVVETRLRELVQAFDAGDFDTAEALFAPDGVADVSELVPDEGVLRGRAAIRAYWERMFAVMALTHTSIELVSADTLVSATVEVEARGETSGVEGPQRFGYSARLDAGGHFAFWMIRADGGQALAEIGGLAAEGDAAARLVRRQMLLIDWFDLDGAADMLCDDAWADATRLIPGEPRSHGPAEIRAYWERALTDLRFRHADVVTEPVGDGPVVVGCLMRSTGALSAVEVDRPIAYVFGTDADCITSIDAFLSIDDARADAEI